MMLSIMCDENKGKGRMALSALFVFVLHVRCLEIWWAFG